MALPCRHIHLLPYLFAPLLVEQIAYRLVLINALNEISQHRSKGNADNLIALLLRINRNSIGNNELLDAGILNPLGCRVRQDTMGTAGIYILGTQLHQSLGTLAERTGSINHIINHDAGL